MKAYFVKSHYIFSFLGLFCRICEEIKIADFASQGNVLGCGSYRGFKPNFVILFAIFVILFASCQFCVTECCGGNLCWKSCSRMKGKKRKEWKSAHGQREVCDSCQEIKMQKNKSNEVLLMEFIVCKTSRKVLANPGWPKYLGFLKDYYPGFYWMWGLSPVFKETEQLEMRKTNGTSKNGRCSVIQTTATEVTERAWRCNQRGWNLNSTAVKGCFGLSVRVPLCALLVTLICKGLFIQGSARASHTPAKATTSASGLGQLWNSIKSKCCLMFYFLSTNIKERREKRESWRAGEEGEKSQLLLQKRQFLSKNLSLTSFPSKHFVMHISVWL